MKTVKELKEELNKFPDDAKCYAYEGEITGLIIRDKNKDKGIIHCADNEFIEPKTILLS